MVEAEKRIAQLERDVRMLAKLVLELSLTELVKSSIVAEYCKVPKELASTDDPEFTRTAILALERLEALLEPPSPAEPSSLREELRREIAANLRELRMGPVGAQFFAWWKARQR